MTFNDRYLFATQMQPNAFNKNANKLFCQFHAAKWLVAVDFSCRLVLLSHANMNAAVLIYI